MELYTLDNGMMIINTDMDKRNGLIIHLMRDNTLKVKFREEGLISGLMAAILKESGLIIKYMVKENTFGVMEEGIRVHGRIIKCMVMECINGEMAECIMANMLMIKNKGKGSACGQMGRFLKESDMKVNRTEKVNFQWQTEE
ncbi:unnamed protein product (macronuclear) [Paramecium tetraurelia]|uniref:Uncharacterized protein n=1 Tax=Paramecium tetraurelia TaxID=5888 RepID=A0CKA6_PARTE|nr:uncharacterized protein GSPATT00000936001 [Paramecium tetraurelia]CAK71223.1 unnamed protein product [Paramecium tetraurelia]|eukprot:XP_001438620.1 hypothetical protein (macronuclear) [Paramecium tetraurelia strain d4-2]